MGRTQHRGNETDCAALLAIRSQLTDPPAGIFSSWNYSLHHCYWEGVTCGHENNRVIVLNLGSSGLVGTISPFIGNLSFLQDVDFSNNSLVGRIPSEIGRLLNLIVVGNDISGTILTSIINCSLLTDISVGDNNLHGELPPDIGLRLPHLVTLNFFSNQFSGAFPYSVLNLTGLQNLDINTNNFVGRVPRNIGHLHNFVFLGLAANYLQGDINFVDSLVNCSNLEILELSGNKFTGVLPETIANLSTSLQLFSLEANNIGGTLPGNILHIVDPKLEENEMIEEVDDVRAVQAIAHRRVECMKSLIKVAISCSKYLPQDRMKISDAISKLQVARDSLCNAR